MGKGNRGLSYIAMLDVEIESSFPISTLKRPEDLFPLVSTHYRLIYEITHLQSDRKTCAPKQMVRSRRCSSVVGSPVKVY